MCTDPRFPERHPPMAMVFDPALFELLERHVTAAVDDLAADPYEPPIPRRLHPHGVPYIRIPTTSVAELPDFPSAAKSPFHPNTKGEPSA